MNEEHARLLAAVADAAKALETAMNRLPFTEFRVTHEMHDVRTIEDARTRYYHALSIVALERFQVR